MEHDTQVTCLLYHNLILWSMFWYQVLWCKHSPCVSIMAVLEAKVLFVILLEPFWDVNFLCLSVGPKVPFVKYTSHDYINVIKSWLFWTFTTYLHWEHSLGTNIPFGHLEIFVLCWITHIPDHLQHKQDAIHHQFLL